MKTHPFFGVQIFIVSNSILVIQSYLSGLPPRPFAYPAFSLEARSRAWIRRTPGSPYARSSSPIFLTAATTLSTLPQSLSVIEGFKKGTPISSVLDFLSFPCWKSLFWGLLLFSGTVFFHPPLISINTISECKKTMNGMWNASAIDLSIYCAFIRKNETNNTHHCNQCVFIVTFHLWLGLPFINEENREETSGRSSNKKDRRKMLTQ